MKLYHFKSYSMDNYYLLADDDAKIAKNAREFCKKYVDWEYEHWGRGKEAFKYSKFDVYDVHPNGLCVIPLSFGELDVIDTKKMKKNVALFSDYIHYLVYEYKPGKFCQYDKDTVKELFKDNIK